MAQYKVNLTFPPELMREIDEYCKRNYLTRSGFVQLASITFLNADKTKKALAELTAIVRRMADEQSKNGGVSDSDMQQLADVEKILKMMNAN